MQDYETERAEALAEAAEELNSHLDNLREAWEDQIEWWETDWSKLAQKEEQAPPEILPAPVVEPSPTSSDISLESDINEISAEDIADLETPTVGETCEDCDMIIASGIRQSLPALENTTAITVELRPWSPDRPYLKALADLPAKRFEREYIKQRNVHGDHPSFYLEIADQLHGDGRTDRAVQMAATALELETATDITRTNVANRLLMYGQMKTAIELYRDVLPLAQDRPQPFYNLALALIRAGDNTDGPAQNAYYREAFEHLAHIIRSPWEEDYEGIHRIALMDLNRTLTRLPKSKQKKIQKKLGLDRAFYKNLSVDIRVLVDWTANDADLDIHVLEGADSPDEEKAFYANPSTRRGGRVSNDMTDGYGPEEYIIRKAPNGLYRVESDYFAQDTYTEDGALKLRARLWQNFGRTNERYETVIIEMVKETEDAYVLGEIQIGPVSEPVAVDDETE